MNLINIHLWFFRCFYKIYPSQSRSRHLWFGCSGRHWILRQVEASIRTIHSLDSIIIISKCGLKSCCKSTKLEPSISTPTISTPISWLTNFSNPFSPSPLSSNSVNAIVVLRTTSALHACTLYWSPWQELLDSASLHRQFKCPLLKHLHSASSSISPLSLLWIRTIPGQSEFENSISASNWS